MADRKWVLGNWKMNGRTAANQALLNRLLPKIANASSQVYAGFAVPDIYFSQVSAVLREADTAGKIAAGAQNVSRFAADGAFTGETSAAMLADAGAEFALVGHSERRRYFGENEAETAEKILACTAAGIVPVLCVGETAEERHNGRAEETVARQLSAVSDSGAGHIVVAYEPVWAIGSGASASAGQIEAMHDFIFNHVLSLCGENVTIRVLYGGSVHAGNAADIMAMPLVGGALVGGASLQADEFAAVVDAAQRA